MFWFQLVVVLLLLAAVGWLAVGGGGHMSEPVPDRADLALPDDRMVAARDLDQVRFSVGLRGYRMEEVDDVLDRLAREVALRDRRIAVLEGRSGDGSAEDDADGADGGEPGPGEDGDSPYAAAGEERHADLLSAVSASPQERAAEDPAAAGTDEDPGADLPPLPRD